MKRKTKILLTILTLSLIVIIITSMYMYFNSPTRLTSTEKNYLASATGVENVNVLNNANVFGSNGEGVYYDFLTSFTEKYGIKINNVTFNVGESVSGVSLTSGNSINDNEFSFYESHYVLVGKKLEYIASSTHLTNQKIGIISTDASYLNELLSGVSLTSYSTRDALLEAFDEQENINYILVPLHLYLDEILENDYYIVSHFEDIPYYFKVNMGSGSLGTILKKYYISWSEDYLEDSYRDYLFDEFVTDLDISLTEIDTLRSVTYKYGFVENRPYEILTGGNFGGIVAQYLKDFTEFSDTEITFTKYRNLNKFTNAINSNSVDLYFGYYDLSNSYEEVSTSLGISLNIVASKEDDLVLESIKDLKGLVVYVEENSSLYTYLKNNSKATVKTYKNKSELKKLIRNKQIIAMDSNSYYALEDLFNKYSVRLSVKVDSYYSFKLNTNEVFTKLFTKFVNVKSPMSSTYKGIYNYDLTLRMGTITGTIARYFMYILIIAILIFLYVYRITKRVKISKKIKKEDKLKYIDQLTSLKNRNYLSENLEAWSQNTIYPQAVVVIDLNNLQYINDTMGYEKGDDQIKATANILVKTQLDNSDIIRTDGNEFVIYMVGYQTKQVTNYMHKLSKEFKKLPYDYGAAIGYSMIEDKLKSVEDAINEAVEEVKRQKSKIKEEQE